MKRKVNTWKKVAAGGAIAATLGLGFWASKAFYEVKEVIDGDTFITKENQIVRLDSVYAPEIDACLGKEAKDELSRLVLNKKVYIKVTYFDGHRLIASAFTLNGSVGEKMLSKGLATFATKGLQNQDSLLRASQKARKSKIGVYSSTCTQTENPINPKCNIKGNTTAKELFYRYPGCSDYEKTLVQLHLGDKWFCTEKEAKSAGFSKGSDCP